MDFKLKKKRCYGGVKILYHWQTHTKQEQQQKLCQSKFCSDLMFHGRVIFFFLLAHGFAKGKRENRLFTVFILKAIDVRIQHHCPEL